MRATGRTWAKVGAMVLGSGLAIALCGGAASAAGSGPSIGGSTQTQVTSKGAAVKAKPPAGRGSNVRGTHAVHG